MVLRRAHVKLTALAIHQPIVDQALWNQVQVTLAENRVGRAVESGARKPSLLAGLVFDETGERLTPSHAVKKGTRYRYYVSRSLITGTAKDKPNGRRIPAANLENLVTNKLRDFLADQGAILDAISHECADGTSQNQWIARGLKIAEELESLAPNRMRAMLMGLVNRVDIKPDRVEINLRRSCLSDLLSKDSINSIIQGDRFEQDANDIMTLKVPARLQRVGREMKMLVENSDDQTKADPGLLRIIARAHDPQERVMQNNDLTLHTICQPGARHARLYLSPPARSFAGARHHYGDRQWQESASAHRQKADATGARIASRLERTTQATWIPINGLTRSDDAAQSSPESGPTGGSLATPLFLRPRPLKC
jgi:hypothetical protein